MLFRVPLKIAQRMDVGEIYCHGTNLMLQHKYPVV
jgi:hypothetical protein